MRKLHIRQSMRIVAILLSILFIIIVILGGILHLTAAICLHKDIIIQKDYLSNIGFDEPEAISERHLSSFYPDQHLHLNHIQVLATHNSYKKKMFPLYHSFESMVTNSKSYAHNTLTNQLNNGIRGLELDIRYQHNQFYIYHFPIFDNRTHNPLWKETLLELLLWSQRNPDHTMINIIIELKNENFLINPLYKKMTPQLLQQLDQTIVNTIGLSRLITPEVLKNGHNSLEDMVVEDDWIDFYQTKGKFMFLLHQHKKHTDEYINLDTSMSSQIMVPLIESKHLDRYKEYAAVLLHNEPDVLPIQKLVLDNYMVRTRMDINGRYDKQRAHNALNSGAQIITTDLEPGRKLPEGEYNSYLEANYTIRKNPLFT